MPRFLGRRTALPRSGISQEPAGRTGSGGWCPPEVITAVRRSGVPAGCDFYVARHVSALCAEIGSAGSKKGKPIAVFFPPLTSRPSAAGPQLPRSDAVARAFPLVVVRDLPTRHCPRSAQRLLHQALPGHAHQLVRRPATAQRTKSRCNPRSGVPLRHTGGGAPTTPSPRSVGIPDPDALC